MCVLLVSAGCVCPIAEQPPPCSNERLYEVRVDRQWGYVDDLGDVAVPACFEIAFRFRDGYAVAKPLLGHWVVLDACGNRAVIRDAEPVNNRVGPDDPRTLGGFGDGLCLARESGIGRARRYGYIDSSGTWAISPQFVYAAPFSEGLAAAQRVPGEPIGYINTQGAWVLPPRFADAHPFSEGLALVRFRDQWAICNRGGSVTSVEERVDSVWCFSNGLCSAVEVGGDGRLGFIGPDGRWAIEPRFTSAWYPGHGFSEGLAAVKDPESGLWGYIDTFGAWRIPAQFQRARSFRDGKAPAQERDGDWGYIDARGAWAILPQFDTVDVFEGALAKANFRTDVLGIHEAPGVYVDRNGDIVWPRERE